MHVGGVIAASFFRIARRIGDVDFVEHSWSFLRASGFFGGHEVAAEYCSVTIGRGQDIRQIFLTVLPHIPLVHHSGVIQDVISQLLPDNLDLALKVYAWARQSDVVLDSCVVRELGMQVATSGNTVEAVRYLEDPGLCLEHKLDVVTVLLQCAVDPSQEFHSPELFARSVDTLVRTSDRPGRPPGGFEESLLAALMVRRHPWLPRVVATIQRPWRFFFSERFLTLAAEELVQQHQPRMALLLLRRGGLVGADVQDALVPRLLRAQAYKPAGSMLGDPWPAPKPPSLSPRLLDLLQSSRKKPSRSLKVPALWSAATSPGEVGLLAKALVRHVGLTKLSLADAGAQHRTALGNTILHASATRGTQAQAARVRRVLGTFRRLRDEQGFVPDRVTTNVLVGALLRWSAAVDAAGVRALFDRMVRSGYPAGDACAPGAGPFRTPVADGVRFEVPEVAAPIQYAAHVRPLYKMFVKALYLRGDAEGARVIVGILKGLEVKERMARVQRSLDSDQGAHRGKKRGDS
ncbi:hypothetical protein PsYK624_107220 [Phanerochaete sordida]|uniref:Uncharacterized protein n=1 Tax=Phanerochaete sordida TaxID=48140 RepID=A0A9P3GF52_9APHY|nr:hypothetical protein PsYK624_107220 [Phanerochaete sordida]